LRCAAQKQRIAQKNDTLLRRNKYYAVEGYFMENNADIINVTETEVDVIPLGEIVKAAAIHRIAIFAAGIIAGYIVDGVLLFATGFSGRELAAQALSNCYEAVQVSASGLTKKRLTKKR
jgi:hypothetical protein